MPYVPPASSGGGVSDGDKGDITVSSSGATWTIDANAVTNTKAAQMTTKTYKGRTNASTGDPEDVPVATLKTDLVLVKADVGLANVDNTNDAGKPVSTAQQTAIDLKANLASPTFTGTVGGVTATMVGLGNVDNTSNATERAATATLTNKTINASQLVNTTVTPDKLNLAPATSFVVTDQTTTSTSYVDLTTVQSVTVTIGVNGLALATWSAGIYTSLAAKRVSVAVSGATTVAANDDYSIRNDGAAFIGTQSTTHLFTGLNAGSTTFTLKFKTSSGTGNFFERRLTVIPL